MKSEATIPEDLTDFSEADFETEIRPLLEILAADPQPRPGRRVRAVVLDRALTLLRTASRSEIRDEAYALHRFLDSEAGETLARNGPELFGGLSAIARLLSAAADRADPAAVESILRNHKGRGQQVLEILADRGEPMPRALLRRRLGMSESHLSHVLRELQQADLVVRYPSGKEVMVDLAATGREVVERSVLPSWVQLVVDRLTEIAQSRARGVDPEQLAEELHQLGAPSPTAAAARIAKALGELAGTEKTVPRAAYVEGLHFRDTWLLAKLAEDQGTHLPVHFYGRRPSK